jgi:purine nucleosidase
MNTKILFRLLIITLLSFHLQVVYSQRIKIILDTDIDSDVDDVGAMAMLHTLADNKVVYILGVIVTSDDKYAPTCADAINCYFKRPDIPLGVQQGIPLKEFSKYTRQISGEFKHNLKSYEDAENATTLYRRLLASQPDTSVTIITIGHLTNLSLLLNSEPDKYSSLNGVDLVRKKVKLWSCMGGLFPEGKEANFYRPDPASTSECLNKWPGEVVFAGWEVGTKIITGGAYLEKKLPKESPVRRAYMLYNNFNGRQSWDQASVLFAISPYNYWNVIRDGYCFIEKDGSNKWLKDKINPKQGYLVEKMNPDEIAKIIDALMIGVYKKSF